MRVGSAINGERSSSSRKKATTNQIDSISEDSRSFRHLNLIWLLVISVVDSWRSLHISLKSSICTLIPLVDPVLLHICWSQHH